jgi:hypothetical protein
LNEPAFMPIDSSTGIVYVSSIMCQLPSLFVGLSLLRIRMLASPSTCAAVYAFRDT